METTDSVFMRGAKIVGVAGLAAGVAGAMASWLFPGRREPSAQERLKAAIRDLTQHEHASIRESIAKALESTTEAARSDFEASLKEGRKRRKRARKKGAAELSAGEHLLLALAEGTSRVGENIRHVLEQAPETAASLTDRSGSDLKKRRKRARKQTKALRKELEAAAREGRAEAMKLRKDARGKTEDRLHELEERARETVERVKPSIEKAGAVAATSAAEARKRLEEEARELEQRYAKARPVIEERAERYAELLDNLRSELRHVADDRAPEVEKALQQLVREITHTTKEGAEQARHIASDAGEKAAEGGRSFGSLLVWLAIAGGIVYAILMNEEQKRKARELAKSAYHEGKAIYQDVRGHDAEFTT